MEILPEAFIDGADCRSMYAPSRAVLDRPSSRSMLDSELLDDYFLRMERLLPPTLSLLDLPVVGEANPLEDSECMLKFLSNKSFIANACTLVLLANNESMLV